MGFRRWIGVDVDLGLRAQRRVPNERPCEERQRGRERERARERESDLEFLGSYR